MNNNVTIRVLVDADFLVNSQNNADRLFTLINSHRELEVTVIRECLERACQSRGMTLDDFSFPRDGIQFISHRDLTESVLAYLETANQYTQDFDSQLEMAYALDLRIHQILTDQETDFGQADLNTSLKFISIDKLEDPDPKTVTKSIQPKKSKIQILIDSLTNLINKHTKRWSLLLLALIIF